MKCVALRLLAATALTCPATAAMSTTIEGWNLDNVAVPPEPVGGYEDGVTYESVVYDRDVTGGTAGAASNGVVQFEPPEAGPPGIKALTNQPDLNNKDVPNCVGASSAFTCEGPFQSGKRFKLRLDGAGPIDLVFDTSAGSEQDGTVTTDPYRLFGKLKNATGESLGGFRIELGFNVGDEFVGAQPGDGISFEQLVSPEKVTQFPFGLFGDASQSENHTLDGFFAAERAGFEVSFGATVIESTGLYGPYADFFGDWRSIEDAPDGYFWDDDGDPDTDAILMAWEMAPGVWEQRRTEDGVLASPAAPFLVDESDLIAEGYLLGVIEDVVNLNINYNIAFDGFADGTSFTMRVTGIPAPVPLPGGLALMAGALAMLGGLRRFRRAA